MERLPNANPFDINVSNFVSVKLSGSRNYLLWKAQMLCMLDSNNMCGILDDTFVAPNNSYSGAVTMRQYDSLVIGWIFCTVNESALMDVFNLGSAKAVWEKLKSIYDPSIFLEEDSFKNNILHLVGRLAPSSVLNQRRGAALQLQHELQWREEAKKFVIPTYITKENIFKETPVMVFTREHGKLVKEGEKWIKTTANSCTITAALITTIVFTAAITVPGGSNNSGIPVLKKNKAFILFAISDAISLFSSSTALMVFLSILTTSFAVNDFLERLPKRLLIGLVSLSLSTITMILAFSASLFLVFCNKKGLVLHLICGLAFIQIIVFINLQYPLTRDLLWSARLNVPGKKRIALLRRFNLDGIRLRFAK